jgi:succinate-semialdehyde dehydrogenase/glutarate-semialdehyde dehydrogenase
LELNVNEFAYPDLYLWIGGKKISAQGRDHTEVLNPATGKLLGQMPHATEADLAAALESSSRAFKMWRSTQAWDRAAVLSRAAALMRERTQAFARAASLEVGKPIGEAAWEVTFTADNLEWHGEEAKRIYGRVIESRLPHGRALVTREPVGPVAAFAPWNLPVLLTARKIAAAIAAGCSIIMKPSEETPGTCIMLAELFADAGLPAGVLNVVLGDPAFISRTLIGSSIIRKVSFTGPTHVGKLLAELAAQHVIPVTMELGGHAPVIICDDADVDAAVSQALPNKFLNAGASCVSPSRFFVQDGVYDEFVTKFAAGSKALKVGDPLADGTQMGPLANARRLDAMELLIKDAVDRGARLVTGGKRIGNEGYFFEPTVLADVTDEARIMNEEPFGPVAALSRFNDLDTAIARANRLPFGLGAYAFTGSIAQAHKLADEIESGMIGINTFAIAAAETPFGGVKQSGYGSEAGAEAIDSYLVTKFVAYA